MEEIKSNFPNIIFLINVNHQNVVKIKVEGLKPDSTKAEHNLYTKIVAKFSIL